MKWILAILMFVFASLSVLRADGPDEQYLRIYVLIQDGDAFEKNGDITYVHLLRGTAYGEDLNEEALRLVKSMPKWIPGRQNGHPVRLAFILPIHFRL